MKYFISLLIFAGVFTFSEAVFAPMGTKANSVSKEEAPSVIVVTGDIMLGRAVEGISETRGFQYPFLNTAEIFSGADVVFSNFEGSLPAVHERTPDYSFRFSFAPAAVSALRDSGVNVVTLANNHALDFGEAGYGHTTAELAKEGIASVGHPVRMGESLSVEKAINGRKVRFIGLNDTFTPINVTEAQTLVRSLARDDAFVVVAVHWGDEYSVTSNVRQQKLARALIDAGADVILGHHPHVVEEIEVYRGKPIFYSLGNFIFDQYFSEDVQKGLAVKITIAGEEASYDLIPVDLHGSQPKKMTETEAERFLSGIPVRCGENEEYFAIPAQLTFAYMIRHCNKITSS